MKKIFCVCIGLLVGVLLIIGVPLIINECYLRNNGYLTVWEGADVFAYYGAVLSFIGTTILSLLALWQNKRLSDENAIAQNKLKEISERANELNIISKIVEYESKRLYDLETLLTSYVRACDPQTLLNIALENNKLVSNVSLITELTKQVQEIDDLFFKAARQLNLDSASSIKAKSPIGVAFFMLYDKAKDYIEYCRKNPNDVTNVKILTPLTNARNEMLEQREKYLGKLEKKLHKLLYENLSLEEIRKMYQEK